IYSEPRGADNDAFVMKLTPDGTQLLYSTYLGDDGNEYTGGYLAVDQLEHAYVAATSYHDPGSDVWAVKLKPDGSDFDYSTHGFLGGTAELHAITVDRAGSLFLTGTTSAALNATPNSFQPQLAGSYDAYVAK